jgi:hypothetical protein
MRLSVDRDDIGYAINTDEVKVMFNGEEISRCVTADEEKGVAIVLTGAVHNGEFEAKPLYGKVEIVVPDGWEKIV